MKRLIAATLAATAMMAAAPAVAQPGGQYGRPGGGYGAIHLEGLRVDNAKSQLANAGYTKARNINVGGRQYDLWSNARAHESCVGFTSYNGTVTDVRAFSNAECGIVSGGWGPGGFNPSGLHGLRVDDGKRNLRDFGYTQARNVRIEGQQWDLWRNERGRACVGFTSYNGRITAARDFRRGECDGGWNNGGGWGGGWLRPEDLRGLSVDQAKRELSNSGFDHERNIRISGKQWDLWRDDRGRDGRCVGITSYNGRVTDVRNFSERDC